MPVMQTLFLQCSSSISPLSTSLSSSFSTSATANACKSSIKFTVMCCSEASPVTVVNGNVERRSAERSEVRLGLPSKGRMASDTLDLLKDCQLSVRQVNPRQYVAEIPQLQNLEVWFQRPKDVVRKLVSGDLDLGIVGLDTVYEYGQGNEDLIIVHDALEYGDCRLSLAIPKYGIFENINSLKELAEMPHWTPERPLRVATGFTYMGPKFMNDNGLKHVTFSTADGALEAAPAMGIADAIVDLVSSGTTLRENNLKEIAGGVILQSQAVLVASRKSLTQRKGALDITHEMLERLEAHLRASGQFTVVAFNATPPRRTLFSLRPPRFSVSGESTQSHRVSLAESLQSETLEVLEWPAVCSQLAAFTSTSMGLSVAQSARIPLGRSPEESRRLLAQTSAAVAVPRPLDFSGIEDVSRIVDTAIAGQMLSIREICAVKRTLIAARSLLKQLEEISFQSELCERWSPLIEILQNCDFLVELAHHIEFCIDCDLSVILDRASEELEIVRSERKRNMENLELMLKQVSSRIFQAGGIDRPLVTKRRSRMCVGVRASHRSLLPNGVVLNVSSTGSTYFMEPEEAVELNNMEVKLSSAERDEEQAILSSLTSEIARSKVKIKCLLDRVLEMDIAFARAAHAHWMNGVCPALSSENCNDPRFNDLSVDIEGIQHPLLLECSLRRLPDIVRFKSRSSLYSDQRNDAMDFESVTRASAFPVPIDIKIEHGTRVVVISGPNTGGKTASMKTLGLASVMFKAGMYLPAQNKPRLPWFDLILADIGDNQSVEQNLSTFSGHMLRLCKILEAASESSLILVDEIGSGTDPSEGVALATSILQYIKERVNLAVVTTHYGDLTRLKEKDNRFCNAAMEFSLDTLQPTFRILWGSMGESNALMIAKSIGVNESIISRAQSWVNKLTPDKMQEQKGLLYQSLVAERDRLETQAKKAASLHSNIMNLFQEIQDEAQDLDEREKALKAKETQKIQQEVMAVKREIEAVLKDFENQLKTIDILQVNSLIKKSESAISSIIEAHQPSEKLAIETGQSFYTPRVGEQVLLKSLGNKLATIVEEPGDDETVLVQYGKIRVRVDKSNIRALPTNSATGSVPSSRTQGQGIKNLKELRNLTTASNINQDSYGPVVQTSKNSVDLRGMRAEEASHHLSMAIDARPPNSVLFVVHGMGTGVIKVLALKLLRDHPRVVKFEQESPLNYGCTVAYIK